MYGKGETTGVIDVNTENRETFELSKEKKQTFREQYAQCTTQNREYDLKSQDSRYYETKMLDSGRRKRERKKRFLGTRRRIAGDSRSFASCLHKTKENLSTLETRFCIKKIQRYR